MPNFSLIINWRLVYSGSQESEVCPMPYARRVPHVTEKGYILKPNICRRQSALHFTQPINQIIQLLLGRQNRHTSNSNLPLAVDKTRAQMFGQISLEQIPSRFFHRSLQNYVLLILGFDPRKTDFFSDLFEFDNTDKLLGWQRNWPITIAPISLNLL